MSHFVTLVILPEGTALDDVPAAVENLMAPYDETRRYEPYQRPCWCIGLKARREVQEEVEKAYPAEELRSAFAELPDEERTQERWLAMNRPRVAMSEQRFEAHPLKEMPSEKCADCEGTGVYVCADNPHGKWDWYEIGGRWDGWIHGPESEHAAHTHHRLNPDAPRDDLRNNTRLVRDIPIAESHYVPFALLTPDGEWHQAGIMHTWAIVTDAISPGVWHGQVKAILTRYPEHLAVAVDCHI